MTGLAEIKAHGWQLALDPGRGGQIVRCEWNGEPILATGTTGRWPKDQDAGCFPLLPFSNRIRNGSFDFAGKNVRLTEADFAMPHALHGTGWRRAWHITQSRPDTLQMTLEHDAGDWPWSYRAEQTVRVDPDALTVSLSLQNLSSDAMPIGIGFHPYFPRRDGMRIKVDCEGVWETDPGDPGLPVNWNRVSPNASFRGSQAVAGLDLDNCFTGWNGHLHLEYPDTALLVSLRASDALGNLVIFCPKNSDFLCLEPVSHVTDAINMLDVPVGQAMDLLAPGERFSAEIRLSARYSQ